MKSIVTLILLCSVFISGDSVAAPAQVGSARNVVLFVGDGMGVGHLKAARWVAAGEHGKLSMDAMPVSGMLSTHSSDSPVTDSAAAATAMAAGVKTKNGAIAMDELLVSVPTILEIAAATGRSVGLVTTTPMAHATPAAFAAHVENRKAMPEIARQMLVAEPDLLLGGGEDEFLPSDQTGCHPQPGERDDGRDLIAEAVAEGYLHVCDKTAFDAVDPHATSRLLGFFSDEGMKRPFSPSLAEMTTKAINMLSTNRRGFFLMVEAGQIDWASHDNDAGNAIADTLGLDEAVEVARKFAAEAGETLVIVTADHETGGMRVTRTSSGKPDEDGPFRMPNGGVFYINWSTTRHTPLDVPVISQGPLSDRFAGENDNTHVFKVMASALGAE